MVKYGDSDDEVWNDTDSDAMDEDDDDDDDDDDEVMTIFTHSCLLLTHVSTHIG